VSAKRRRTVRDARRRSLGQNFLADQHTIAGLIDAASIEPGDLIVEPGAGTGALTIPLAEAGARVVAYETDPFWTGKLAASVEQRGLQSRVQLLTVDFLRSPLPTERFRVVANPPFHLTTVLLARLLDHPDGGPWRVDLVVQREVADKRSVSPPRDLRSAAWAPWWVFERGPTIPRRSFRPVPDVDAALLTIRRREPPILPDRLAPQMRELLRKGWGSAGTTSPRR
jgi:23S rRNA (adenine-N6)-dimethyltransferase